MVPVSLVSCRFPGDDVPVVRGSALCALKGEKQDIGKDAILKLMQVGCWKQVGSWRAESASTLPAKLAVQRQTNTHTAWMHAHTCTWALGCGQCIRICDNSRVSFGLFVLRVDIRVADPTP
jgi:ferredoxin